MRDRLKPLYRRLGFELHRDDLLIQALTHRSAGVPNNERLEFLGDALLNWVIADLLYGAHPESDEGDLTRLRANLVREASLAGIALNLELGDHLILGPGERRGGGFRRQSILADGLEAVIAAIYLDGGLEAAHAVIERLFKERLAQLPDTESLKDAKTRLQEFLQGRGLPLPHYEVLDVVGQAHQQQFHVRCAVEDGARFAEGNGGSRRKAEQAAAARLLKQLEASA